MFKRSYRSLQLPKQRDSLLSSMSTSSLISRASALGRSGRNLKTPLRRFLKLGILKLDTGSDSKHARTVSHDTPTSAKGHAQDPTIDTPPPLSDVISSAASDFDTSGNDGPVRHVRPPPPHNTPLVPCMALQNSDHSIDAVVISTLLKLPFCCHEDLLTMVGSEVVEVARQLNERLPAALRIDLGEPRDIGLIRREVEELVGIVKKANQVPVPGAPLKRAMSRGQRDAFDDDYLRGELDLSAISPPTSPLAAINTTGRRGVLRFLPERPRALARLISELVDMLDNSESLCLGN